MDTSKSSSLELSLKNQFESFAPCNKLNSTESKPNVTLKKMGEELDIAETKCLTLKSELNYMMGVCQKAQTEIKRSKAAFDISQEPMLSSKSPRLKLPVEYNDDNNEITVTNKISNYNVFQKLCNTEKKAKENFDSTHLSPRFAEFPPKKNVDDQDIIEKTDNLICQTIDRRQKGLLGITITPKDQSDKKFPPTMSQIPVENDRIKNDRTEANTEYENSLPCFSERAREHFQSMLRLEGSVEELASKTDREDYFWAIRPSSVQTDIKVPESSANVADVAKARRTKKSNRATKTERNETSSVCKTVDTASRVRKRKGKLRSFASKSTLTKDISSIMDRKRVKRCRRKARNLATSFNVIHPQSIPIKHTKQSKEILEIFHNTTLKSSHSGISSKYSKFSGQAKTVKQQHVKTNVNQKIQEQLPSEQIDQNQCYSSENQQVQLSNQSNLRTTPEDIQQQNKFTKPSINSSPPIQCKTHQYENTFDRYIESSFTPSYEMPTLASRLKRSSKSYFSKFNFRNIPFVVGTSVTPSYNLGLNIQQVLSVMKMRQPLANDIAPLLIQKGRGMNPVSTFLERINRQCGNSSRQITGAFNSRLSLNTSRDKKFSALDLRNVRRAQNVRVPDVSDNVKLLSERDNNAEQFSKEKVDEHKIKRQFSSVVNKPTLSANAKDQREISGTAMNKHKISNYNTHTSASRNSKEIRDVLINLHNQFEEMNTKYEKLESKVEKSNDKSLAKELSTLEKELNVKEEEINAVISLYKEVTALKQQMKMLHEKNSPVCIELAKETSRKDPFSMSILSGKSQSIKPTEIFRRKAFGATREPPAAMQLAALLRQIQTFHKQLQLVS